MCDLLDPFENRIHRNEKEQEFLTNILPHSEEWFQFGLSKDDCYLIYEDSILTLAFDVCDSERSIVLRCLRIDFSECNLLLGFDESMQYVCPLSAEDSNVKKHQTIDYTIKELSDIAAKWLNFELSRKIERHEWRSGEILHQEYAFEDTNQLITGSNSENKKSWGFGTTIVKKIVFPLKKISQ